MRWIVAGLIALALAGCAANVVTDYNHAAVFGHYATWAFAEDAGEGTFVSLDGSRVQRAVERELNRKAMRQVPADEADLLVNWQIVEEERLEQTGVGLGFGFGSGHFGWGVAAPPPCVRCMRASWWWNWWTPTPARWSGVPPAAVT